MMRPSTSVERLYFHSAPGCHTSGLPAILVAWMHGKPWERVVASTASSAVAVMGLVWLAERLF